jgi:hypothetical protein
MSAHPSRFKLCFLSRCFGLCALWVVVCAQGAGAQTAAPVLLSEENSTRALALESVTQATEPFPPDSPVRWGADGRTRIQLYAMNLALQPGEDASALTAGAEDASGRRYELRAEYVAPVPGFEWMSVLVLRLADDLGDVGDVLVRVSYHGLPSNRVRVAIGHEGGGPPDDAGAVPTPPRFVSGRVMYRGSGLGGVRLLLTGAQAPALKTAADGSYSFIAAPLGDYTITPQLAFFDFDPPTQTLAGLAENRSDVNFSAARQTHAIFGEVHDEAGRALFNYRVRLAGGLESGARANLTDDSGQFSFLNLPAGLSYTVVPGDDNVLTFAPLKIGKLAADVTLSIKGTRRTYSVRGRVTDYAGGLGGVAVELEGVGLKTTTDASGFYHFDGLDAGLPYTVAVSRADYLFDRQSFVIDSLGGDTQADFQATPQFTLSGRVTDADGKGVFGIRMALAGPESRTAFTRADGSYALTVATYGDYTLTPATEQGYYSFAPAARTLAGLNSSRTSDFVITVTLPFSPSRVMEFDGTQKTIDYGLFWDEQKVLGHFFWEFWAMPGAGAGGTYMLSDGYGGAHALLFGFGFFDGSEPGHFQLSGNTWDGAKVVSFVSDEGPQVGEWGYYAAGWDGQYLTTYFDGVPVGRNRFTGQRAPGGAINGAGHLLIGGSDHQNLAGRIAQVRGYEASNPREGDGSDETQPFGPFTPQTVFGREGNFLSYYFRPGDPLSDLSEGYGGELHPGVRRGTLNGYILGCDGCPVPEFVVDPTAPDFSNPNSPGQTPAPAPTPAGVPQGALVFDSFNRRHSTHILGGLGGLGATEGGTSGPRAWRTNVEATKPQPFGILNGRAVLLSNATAVAWVDAGGAKDLEVRVERLPRTWGTGQNTGLSFRVADGANYFFAYTSEGAAQSDPKTLTVGYYLGGVRTELVKGVALPNPQSPWQALRVQTFGDGTIQVFIDSALVYSTTSSVLANATGAGLYNNAPGLGLTNRWDNFTISAAQH